MCTDLLVKAARKALLPLALLASSCNALVRVPESPDVAARPEHTAPLTTAELLRFTLENLGEVEPGLLYRSNQPSLGLLEFLDRRANLRYIVTLRGKPEPYSREFANSCGAESIGLRMSAGRPPTPRQVLELIRVTERARREGGSVLLHCAAGADRTGMMIALWRMLFQGETDRDKLIGETVLFRHFPPAYPNVHRLIEVARPELFLPFVENPELLDDEERIAELEARFFENYPLQSGLDRVTAGPLRAGVAKRSLLDGWEGPVQMATYGPNPGKARGVRDAVHARALTLDNGEARVSIVSCDLLIMSAELRTDVLRRLDANGSGVTDVLLAATHTHTSVGAYVDHAGFEFYMLGEFDEKMFAHLAATIVSTIDDSIDDLRDARLGSGQGEIERLSYNRRLDNRIDTTVGVLAVRTLDGGPLATVVNFAGHPILASADGMISADYPGLVTERLDERDGFGIFLGGALGDVNAGAPARGEAFAEAGLVEPVADELLRVVEITLEKIETRREVELASMTAEIDIPDTNVNILPDLLFPLEWTLIKLMQWPTRHPIQALRIGDTSIVATASEITSLLGLEIKDRSPAPRTFVVTHANGYAGYAMQRVNHAKRKLDAASLVALGGAGHGPIVVEAALELAAEQWDEKPKPAAPPADPSIDPTMPQSRRVTTLVDDGFPYRLRTWLDGVYREQIRGGHGVKGRVRDLTDGEAPARIWSSATAARRGEARMEPITTRGRRTSSPASSARSEPSRAGSTATRCV